MADYDYTSPSEWDRIQEIYDREAEGLLYNRDDLEKMKHRKWLKEFFTTNPFYANPEEEAEKRRQLTAINEWNDKFKRQYGAPPPIETSSEPKMKVELPPVPANGTADDDPGPLAGRHGPIFTGTSASAPPTTDGPLENEKGMPGWGSMPMNMGLLQLGAGMLSQSGWQDDDVSPGQAFGKAMPGAMSSYMTGVKSLQDRDLYQAKMHDILAAREREKGLKESLPGVIDNLKGKISGIPDERLEVIKSLVKSSPKQALQIVSNLASTASEGKFIYEPANKMDKEAGFNLGQIMEVDPTTGKRTSYGKPGSPVVEDITDKDGNVVGKMVLQNEKVINVLSMRNPSSDKSLLEKIGPAYAGLLSDDPFTKAAALDKLQRSTHKFVPIMDSEGNPTGQSELIEIKKEMHPVLKKFAEKNEVPETTDQELPDSVNVENLKYGGKIFEEMRDKYGFKGDMDQFVEYLNENVTHPKGGLWTQDIMPSEIPITGDQWRLATTKRKIIKPQPLSETQGKATSYADMMINAEQNINNLFASGYRPTTPTWKFLEASNKDMMRPDFLDFVFREGVIKEWQPSTKDRQFVRNILQLADASIRDKSGAAIKEGEMRTEIGTLFNRSPLMGSIADQARLEASELRRDRMRSIIEKSGPSKTKLMKRYQALSSPQKIFSGGAQKQLDEWEYELQQNLKTIKVD